jgi:hypothetical protein
MCRSWEGHTGTYERPFERPSLHESRLHVACRDKRPQGAAIGLRLSLRGVLPVDGGNSQDLWIGVSRDLLITTL